MCKPLRYLRLAGIMLFVLMTTACATVPPATLRDTGTLLVETEHALDAGDLATALVKLRQLQQIDPRNIDMLRLTARLHEALGETEAQHDVTARILHQQPDDPPLLTWMGLYELREGRFLAAAEYLQQVVSLDPMQWQAHNGLGVIADAQQRFPDAQNHFMAALAIIPGHPVITANLGWSKVLSGNLVEAEMLLRESLSVAPDTAVTRSNLAFCIALQGRYEEAMQLYLALYDEATAVNNIGYAAAARGDTGAAADYLRRAIRMKPAYYDKAANNLARVVSLDAAATSRP